MTKSIATLRRLRRLAADQARRDLAASLATEQRAAHASAEAAADFGRQAAASPHDAAHPLAGAYAAWLPAGQANANAATQALHDATHAVDNCRDALAQARAAERAVAHVQENQAAAARIAAGRKQQATLDDT